MEKKNQLRSIKSNPKLIKELNNHKKNKTIYYINLNNNQYYQLDKDNITKENNYCNCCDNNVLEPCYVFHKNLSKIIDNSSDHKYLCNKCYNIKKNRQDLFNQF